MNEKKIRTFIAIELPDMLCQYLYAVGQALKKQFPNDSVRWAKPERMHLTLRFLGDTAVSQIDPLATALQTSLAEQPPFSLKLTQLGAFPNKKSPRVVWAGVGGEMAQLKQTQASVETAVYQLNFPPDKRAFNPHLTLGRVRREAKLQGHKWGGRIESLGFDVTAVHLIQSDLAPKGPVYTVLHSAELKVGSG